MVIAIYLFFCLFHNLHIFIAILTLHLTILAFYSHNSVNNISFAKYELAWYKLKIKLRDVNSQFWEEYIISRKSQNCKIRSSNDFFFNSVGEKTKKQNRSTRCKVRI